MSDTQSTGTLCPTCQFGGIHDNMLKTRMGVFGQFCDAGHIFNDSEMLHEQLKKARERFGRQPAPEAKRVEPSQGPPKQQREVPAEVVVVDPENRERLEQILGQKIPGPSDLFGAVFALKQQLKDAQDELERLKRTPRTVPSGGSGVLSEGQFVAEIPEWALEAMRDNAQFNGMDWREYAGQQFAFFIENMFEVPKVG